MRLPDPGNEVSLTDTTSSPLEKPIVATVADLKYPADEPCWILKAMPVDERILYPDSLAKNAAAFFSISFSSRSRRFSSRSLLSSSMSAV